MAEIARAIARRNIADIEMGFFERLLLEFVGILQRSIGGRKCHCISSSAAASNSVISYPLLKVSAFLILAASSSGIGAPVL